MRLADMTDYSPSFRNEKSFVFFANARSPNFQYILLI